MKKNYRLENSDMPKPPSLSLFVLAGFPPRLPDDYAIHAEVCRSTL